LLIIVVLLVISFPAY
ncbi:type I toxin-antitoxin system Ibs family toxin, partial [Escherichia coli]